MHRKTILGKDSTEESQRKKELIPSFGIFKAQPSGGFIGDSAPGPQTEGKGMRKQLRISPSGGAGRHQG